MPRVTVIQVIDCVSVSWCRHEMTTVQASDLNIYTIPPVWKRVAAETIDFLILIVLKVKHLCFVRFYLCFR